MECDTSFRGSQKVFIMKVTFLFTPTKVSFQLPYIGYMWYLLGSRKRSSLFTIPELHVRCLSKQQPPPQPVPERNGAVAFWKLQLPTSAFWRKTGFSSAASGTKQHPQKRGKTARSRKHSGSGKVSSSGLGGLTR